MSFDGPALSFDDEGSILFDGEKIIVTVPVGHEALNHLGTEEEIPFPVVYTHPSHHQNQQASTPPPPPGGNPVFNKDKVREHVERARQARESARDKESKSGKKDVKDDSPADRAPVTDKRDLASDAIDEEPAAEAVWQDYTPLTPGQQMHVDNLLSIETDNLAREVLITLKREGLPPNDQWREFLEQYALTGWYAASDAIAWATLAKIANSDWDETLAYADEDHVETVAQDLGDNAIEGVVVIDAETGDTVFDRTGVVRADGSQYVGMQDTERDALLAEALSGRDLVFVHNHPNGNDASEEDLDSAFAAGAKLLIVITPQGQEFVYIRGRYGMVKVRDDKASYEVGQVNPEETKELRIRSEAQAWAFQHDSPEHIFRQEGPGRLESEIYVPIGLTSEQADEMLNSALTANIGTGFMLSISDWDASWVDNPAEWPEYEKLSELLDSTIIHVARRWHHPALGMSVDEVAALLLAHLRQEGHYRNVGGSFDGTKNWISRTLLHRSPSVGPVNLRPSVVDEILGTSNEPPHIPMLIGPDLHFDDMGLLDSLQSEWQNATSDSEREALLMDDEFSIELAGANIYRGAERLFRTYLFHELRLKDDDDIQRHLEENDIRREDLVERYLQQEEYRASMFSMLGWSSQGIPESDTLRSGSSGAAEVARWHASGGVRTVNAIFVSGAFDLEMDADGVRLFNDDEIYAYRYR